MEVKNEGKDQKQNQLQEQQRWGGVIMISCKHFDLIQCDILDKFLFTTKGNVIKIYQEAQQNWKCLEQTQKKETFIGRLTSKFILDFREHIKVENRVCPIKTVKQSLESDYDIKISQNSTNNQIYWVQIWQSQHTHRYSVQRNHYLLIEQIISEGSSNILLKWPPVSDCQVLQNLIDLTTNQNDQFYFVQQITSYFTDFKDQLITKLDHIQKIMINKALDQQFNKEQI
ncbi:hypothetical protein ABPG72_014024, partial [Tetrahymena utriculariae]